MSERDRLARLLFMAHCQDMPEEDAAEDWVVLSIARHGETTYHQQADAVLAAGYQKEDA